MTMYHQLLAHPLHLKHHLCKELEKMEEAGIIEDDTGQAPCISNIMLAPEKNDDVWVMVEM